MKKLMLGFFTLSLAMPSFADTPVIRAKKVTCLQLQESIRNYGTVTVTTKSFLFTKRLNVSQEVECGLELVKRQAFFNTSDVVDCAAGVYCARRPVVIIDHRPEYPERREPHVRRRIPGPRHDVPGPGRTPPPVRRRELPSDHRPTRPQHRTERPSDSRPTRPQHERPTRPGPRREGPTRVCRGGVCP